MSIRRVSEHHGRTIDKEKLTIITIFEDSVNKSEVRKLTPYCKHHQVLLKRGSGYEFISKKA